jgi:transcriptional regulator with XRE-family HTH domain
MANDDEVRLGDHPLSEIVRRVRRTAGFSQRDLAKYARVSPAVVAALETGARAPSLRTLQRILNAANYQLVAVDASGRFAAPLLVWQDVADGAGRRYPAHLDTIIDPEYGEWWGDVYGLARPPETFHRDPEDREYRQQLSQWEVRVAQHRGDPRPERRFRWRPEWKPPGPPPVAGDRTG